MDVRRLVLLVGLYVTLDLSSPFVPGAFNFDADASVEATLRQPDALPIPVAAPATPPGLAAMPLRSPRVEPPVAPPPAVADWLVGLHARRAAPAEPPPAADDH